MQTNNSFSTIKESFLISDIRHCEFLETHPNHTCNVPHLQSPKRDPQSIIDSNALERYPIFDQKHFQS